MTKLQAYIRQLETGNITPAGLERQLIKARLELEDAIYFKYSAGEIKSLQEDVEALIGALQQVAVWETAARGRLEEEGKYVKQSGKRSRASSVAETAYGMLFVFESYYPRDYRPRKALEAISKWANGKITDEELDAAGKDAWTAARVVSRGGNDEAGAIAAAIGKMVDDVLIGIVDPVESVLIEEKKVDPTKVKELEKKIAGLRFDIQDARKFREPTAKLEKELADAIEALEKLTKKNPGRRRLKRKYGRRR